MSDKPLSDYPWFRFHIAKFMRETASMSDEDVGAYVRRIVTAWISDDIKALPGWVRESAIERIGKTTTYSVNGKKRAIAQQLPSNCSAIAQQLLSYSSISLSLSDSEKKGDGGKERCKPVAATCAWSVPKAIVDAGAEKAMMAWAAERQAQHGLRPTDQWAECVVGELVRRNPDRSTWVQVLESACRIGSRDLPSDFQKKPAYPQYPLNGWWRAPEYQALKKRDPRTLTVEEHKLQQLVIKDEMGVAW